MEDKEYENIIKADGFRFINHLHTTSRQLFVCSEIIKQLENKQLPKDLLFQLMIKWSTKEEEENSTYREDKGKITENGKKTTAFPHYLELLSSLGLISNLNGFYSNSRISSILTYFINYKTFNSRTTLTIGEKIFYFFQLLNIDADGILLVLGLLNNVRKNQIELQKEFKDALINRLKSKSELNDPIVKSQIGEKYRTINFQWKNAEKYAEHLIIPRCEWLRNLGLIEAYKLGSSTVYTLSNKGSYFYNSLPSLNENIKDINEQWLQNMIFSSINSLFFEGEYPKFNTTDKNSLGDSLLLAKKAIKSSMSFRLSLFDTFLFICMDMVINKKIETNFSDLFSILSDGSFVFNNSQYLLKESKRLNEGYIITKMLEN